MRFGRKHTKHHIWGVLGILYRDIVDSPTYEVLTRLLLWLTSGEILLLVVGLTLLLLGTLIGKVPKVSTVEAWANGIGSLAGVTVLLLVLVLVHGA